MSRTTNSNTTTYDQNSKRDTQRFGEAKAIKRLPANRENIFPEDRRRIQKTHSQIARVFQSINQTLGSLSKQDQSKAFLELIYGRAQAPKDGILSKNINILKGLLQVFPREFLASLDQVARGKTAKVLLEVDSQSVYKIIEVEDGLVGGTFPGDIRLRKEDNQILVTGCQRHNLIDCLKAVLISNKQGMALKTQIAGFTPDLAIVLKQQYIHNLEPIPLLEQHTQEMSKVLQKAIKEMGMLLVGDIGSPFAVAPAGGKLAIFDDLHGDNILLNKEKIPVLVDSLATRYITDKESEMIRSYLIEKNKGYIENPKDLEKLQSYFSHKKLNGHLDRAWLREL